MSTTRPTTIAPEENDQATRYVLPKPGRGVGELLVETPPGAVTSALVRHREADVAKSIGTRVTALAQCQQQFLTELRTCLEDVEETVGEAARVRLQGQVRAALSVLDWCEAVQTDLQNEGQWAERGLQPIELVSFCEDVCSQHATGSTNVHVTGERGQAWWGHAGLLAEAITAGVALVSERIGGNGSVAIEIAVQRGVATVHLAGSGEPRADIDPGVVNAFRQAAERLNATVGTDALGPAGAGFVLALPTAGQ